MAEEEREGICGLLEISRISFNPYFQSFDQSTLLNADEEKKQSLHLLAACLPPSDSRSSSSAAASGTVASVEASTHHTIPYHIGGQHPPQHNTLLWKAFTISYYGTPLLAPLTFFHPTKIGHLGDI